MVDCSHKICVQAKIIFLHIFSQLRTPFLSEYFLHFPCFLLQYIGRNFLICCSYRTHRWWNISEINISPESLFFKAFLRIEIIFCLWKIIQEHKKVRFHEPNYSLYVFWAADSESGIGLFVLNHCEGQIKKRRTKKIWTNGYISFWGCWVWMRGSFECTRSSSKSFEGESDENQRVQGPLALIWSPQGHLKVKLRKDL